jgi:hypothetical protein
VRYERFQNVRWFIRETIAADELRRGGTLRTYWLVMNSVILLAMLIVFTFYTRSGDPCPTSAKHAGRRASSTGLAASWIRDSQRPGRWLLSAVVFTAVAFGIAYGHHFWDLNQWVTACRAEKCGRRENGRGPCGGVAPASTAEALGSVATYHQPSRSVSLCWRNGPFVSPPKSKAFLLAATAEEVCRVKPLNVAERDPPVVAAPTRRWERSAH